MGIFIASISIVPVGTCSTSLSNYIAIALKALREANIEFEITPMATIISADRIDEIFKAVSVIHDTLVKAGQKRIVIQINIDARHDKPERKPSDKVVAVLKKIE